MVRVVERVSSIFGAFDRQQPELTLTECAAKTGLTTSSLYRLLTSLEEVRLVERNESKWRLGPRVVELAALRLGQFELRREAESHLLGLRDQFNAAVAFSVPDGSEMIYLDRLDSRAAYGVSARLGARAPIWAGGSGKAILAAIRREELDNALADSRWRRLTRGERERILGEVEEARERGFATDNGEFFGGIGGVAVAIRSPSGDPVAALSVVVPRDGLSSDFVERVAESLRASASELEATLRTSQLQHAGSTK